MATKQTIQRREEGRIKRQNYELKISRKNLTYRGCFRFDKRLLKVDGVQANIKNAWEFATVNGAFSLSDGIKACRKSLSSLKRRVNMNSKDRITQAQIALEQEQGVRLIAESALAVSTFQSYVAIGYPSWCSRAVDFGNGLA
ncbi:hypothetical protein HID58_086531 [Brassica napus]|uniref:Uncharacterized protein n=1 Tax=Brassica napus TaxID=3708 RepID=A0ABQ7XTM3_BRANA|nr:hypothetical protein HID58_086531 [Brassica napus]